MTPISRVNRDIFHDIARWKGARASRRSGTLSRLFARLVLLCRYASCTILQIHQRWMKSFPSCYHWELSRRDESKIPRCKCDRSSNDGPPNGFRLFAQPGFLRIYRLPFGKLLRKFVQFFGEIFIKHIFIIIAFYYILGLHGKIE